MKFEKGKTSTFNIPKDLYWDLKKIAAEERKSVAAFIQGVLEKVAQTMKK